MKDRAKHSSERTAVSDSEMTVLKILWENNPLKVGEVLQAIEYQGFAWVYNTVQTLLNRLKAKGFVETEKVGRALAYKPLVDRQTFISRKMNEVATQVFDGATAPVVLALVEQQTFSKEEIQQFKELLDRLSHEADGSDE